MAVNPDPEDCRLLLRVELAPSVPSDAPLHTHNATVTDSILQELLRLNSEYKHYVPQVWGRRVWKCGAVWGVLGGLQLWIFVHVPWFPIQKAALSHVAPKCSSCSAHAYPQTSPLPRLPPFTAPVALPTSPLPPPPPPLPPSHMPNALPCPHDGCQV